MTNITRTRNLLARAQSVILPTRPRPLPPFISRQLRVDSPRFACVCPGPLSLPSSALARSLSLLAVRAPVSRHWPRETGARGTTFGSVAAEGVGLPGRLQCRRNPGANEERGSKAPPKDEGSGDEMRKGNIWF